MKYLIILAILLTGCSGGSSESAPKREGVAVFCDSTCSNRYDLGGWPTRLESLISEPVWMDARPGWTLKDFDVPKSLRDNPEIHNYRYGVLSLGANDMGQGAYFGDVLDHYEKELAVIASYGLEPVCLTYSYTTIIADRLNDFNDGILIICKGHKIITSTEQLIDGLHPTIAGGMETAENAWRVLY